MIPAVVGNFYEQVGGQSFDLRKLLPSWNRQMGGVLPLVDYAIEQFRNFFSHSYRFFASIIVGSGFWQGIQQQFGGMILTDAFFWLPTFWLISWINGSLWAFRENRWSRQKAVHSVWKLVGYMFILAIAHGLRHFSYVGGYPASLMEIACIFVEGYNALENAAGLTDNAWLKKMIRTSKKQIEDRLGRLIGAMNETKAEIAEVKAAVAEIQALPPTTNVKVLAEKVEVVTKTELEKPNEV